MTERPSELRQPQVLEKERRELGPSAESRFVVYGHGVLTDGVLAASRGRCYLFMAVPF